MNRLLALFLYNSAITVLHSTFLQSLIVAYKSVQVTALCLGSYEMKKFIFKNVACTLNCRYKSTDFVINPPSKAIIAVIFA